MRRMSVRKVLMLIGLTMTTLAPPAWGQYESKGQGRTCSYSFSYTPIYQFETDLDRGGRFDVSRHYLRLNFVRPINRKLKLGLGLGYDSEKWNFSDLPDVAKLDAAAFAPLWQNPLDALEKALPQATSATVVEDVQGLIGYQISTANPFGAHLARLAVRPDAQRRGLGSMIVTDLIRRLKKKGVARLTVNTQSDNLSSLALYDKMGFVVTGEKFPVYCYQVLPS